MSGDESGPPCTSGTLLNGRVRYAQFAHGHRTGIEPVLLAASVPARVGETVLEAGCGAAAGLLCLGWRVPGVMGVGVEYDPATASLARANLTANPFRGLRLVCADVRDPALADLASLPSGRVDHAFANPPWHRAGSSVPPEARRQLARTQVAGNDIRNWVGAMGRLLRAKGTLTLAVPAACVDQAIIAFGQAHIGSVTLMPLWPRDGQAARLVLVRGRKDGRGDCQLLSGLVLHCTDGSFTSAVEAILRDGAPLLF
ncbi:methyltransferase [Ameyamaea chiangmaiensis]|uniref:Methyltransferase n=1 Tax=Ameyamaea chiangmaiensis TaxID=442969 RepID=A0A850P5E9_9PROT|nr:methyltransferase [Ameyamaea chiangmaiensis]NVN39857.1 methyltransferase [Ameyamaea chiangmaiensis]